MGPAAAYEGPDFCIKTSAFCNSVLIQNSISTFLSCLIITLILITYFFKLGRHQACCRPRQLKKAMNNQIRLCYRWTCSQKAGCIEKVIVRDSKSSESQSNLGWKGLPIAYSKPLLKSWPTQIKLLRALSGQGSVYLT